MKSANQIQRSNVTRFLEKMPTIFKWVSFFSVLLLPVITMAAGAETKAMSVEYRDVPGIGSNNTEKKLTHLKIVGIFSKNFLTLDCCMWLADFITRPPSLVHL